MMVEEIGHMAKELKVEGEEVIILQHLVLSHHGKAEWGSPKPPLVQEAEILHLIDLIDAKMNMLDRALTNQNYYLSFILNIKILLIHSVLKKLINNMSIIYYYLKYNKKNK